MKLRVLNEQGKEVPVVMGSYGIGVERLVAAVIEAYHDADGVAWPWSVAPLEIVVTPVSIKDEAAMRKAEEIYEKLSSLGYEVLLDDRDERPGVKFKDADLVGFPLRVVPGPRSLEKGMVELFDRSTRTKDEVPIERLFEEISARVSRLKAAPVR
jgi:prolyl-tRNA synthetase